MLKSTEAVQSKRFNNTQDPTNTPTNHWVQLCHAPGVPADSPPLLPPLPTPPVALELIPVAVARGFVSGSAAFVGVGKVSVSLYISAE